MSGTLLANAPATTGYDQWKVDVYRAVGEKTDQRKAPAAPPKTVRNNPLRNVKLAGKPAPTGDVGKFLASRVLGDPDDRHSDASKDDKKVADKHRQIGFMQDEGSAAPVEIVGEGGRKLKGNFFSAKGHNLKEKDGLADTSRPVVLLLTGSGGSAEFQGLDMAKFYADSGASVLSVNYAGYGGSDEPPGTPCELSLKQDAQSMLQHLIDMGYDPDKIIIHGYSMGAAVAAELQEANESAGTMFRFRGAVLDRPMLSTVHGVESHKGKLSHPIAALARDEVGALQGERAVNRLQSTTPMVITSDKGSFAKRADALRKKLQKGGANVAGARSEADHDQHSAMISANQDALRNLIANDRNGNPDTRVAPPATEAADLDYQELVDECKKAVKEIASTLHQVAGQLAALRTAPDVSAATALLARVRTLTGDFLDVRNYAPEDCPDLMLVKPVADEAMAKLQQFAAELHRMLWDAGQVVDGSPEEIDFVADLAADAVQALEDAGGPDPTRAALEDEVLRVTGMQFKLGIGRERVQAMHGERRDVFDALKIATDEIRLRRADNA